VLHRSRNGCETVAAGTRALASRHGSKDHLRVNSFSRRRGRRIPRRYTSASRREESSRAHLSKSCSASKSTIAVCGRDTNRQAAVHGGLLRSAQNRHRLSCFGRQLGSCSGRKHGEIKCGLPETGHAVTASEGAAICHGSCIIICYIEHESTNDRHDVRCAVSRRVMRTSPRAATSPRFAAEA